MKQLIVLAAVTILGAGPAAAADWRATALGTRPHDQSLHFVDAASVRRSGTMVTFWYQMVLEKKLSDWVRVTQRVNADCDARWIAPLASAYYDENGLIDQRHRPEPRVYALPDSAFEKMIIAACSEDWHSETIDNPAAFAREIFAQAR